MALVKQTGKFLIFNFLCHTHTHTHTMNNNFYLNNSNNYRSEEWKYSHEPFVLSAFITYTTFTATPDHLPKYITTFSNKL